MRWSFTHPPPLLWTSKNPLHEKLSLITAKSICRQQAEVPVCLPLKPLSNQNVFTIKTREETTPSSDAALPFPALNPTHNSPTPAQGPAAPHNRDQTQTSLQTHQDGIIDCPRLLLKPLLDIYIQNTTKKNGIASLLNMPVA